MIKAEKMRSCYNSGLLEAGWAAKSTFLGTRRQTMDNAPCRQYGRLETIDMKIVLKLMT